MNYAPQFKDKSLEQLKAMEARHLKRTGVLADPIVLNIIRQEIAVRNLPPDPEGQNDDRAGWADEGLRKFQRETGTEDDDLVCDFLGDLMHWCDRNGADFEHELHRAHEHYAAETIAEVFTCAGCGRPEIECSVDPCPGVVADRAS